MSLITPKFSNKKLSSITSFEILKLTLHIHVILALKVITNSHPIIRIQPNQIGSCHFFNNYFAKLILLNIFA